MIATGPILFSVTCFWLTIGVNDAFLTDFTNIWPWKKTTPDAGYKKHVQLRLVKKEWMPDTNTIPLESDVLTSYPGTVDQAFKTLKLSAMYEFDDRPLDTAAELLSDQFGYNPDLESIFIIHTISGDAENYFVKNTVVAMAMRNLVKKYNVFALNMPALQDSMEQTVFKSALGLNANFYGLGKAIGSFFDEVIQNNIISPDKIHFIGFCYSSQLAGYIARHVIKNNNGQKIKSILGLDPYSIGFLSVRHQILTAADADLVHLLHTNSMVFGSLYRRGTADFVFNNGSFQPGCFTSTNYQCSHRRSVLLLWYIILYGDKFHARHCRTHLLFAICFCQENPITTLTYPLNPEARGKYILLTSARRPYGLGVSGADCHAKRVKIDKSMILDDKVFAKGRDF